MILKLFELYYFFIYLNFTIKFYIQKSKILKPPHNPFLPSQLIEKYHLKSDFSVIIITEILFLHFKFYLLEFTNIIIWEKNLFLYIFSVIGGLRVKRERGAEDFISFYFHFH